MSKFLSAGLIPLLIWGMVSALCLYLIDLRSAIILGGENRLRIGVLGFAAGAVLVQRLFYQEGRASATRYAVIFLSLITIFSLQSAYAYRIPIHPLIVFLVNCVVFYALWFAGRAVTKGCSADEESAMAAADSGAIRKMAKWKRRGMSKKGIDDAQAARDAELERKWAERLPKKHPGVSLLYFSLMSLPLFALGLAFFNPDEDAWARARLGGYLFVFLFCCMSLLSLASLAQLRAYFERRDVTLPEPLGLAWMSIGFTVVIAALFAAFLLPQPESMPARYMRDRIVSVYKGAEAKWGLSEWLGEGGKQKGGKEGGGGKQKGGKGPTGEKLEGVSEFYRASDKDMAAANEVFQRAIDKIVRVLIIVGIIAGLATLYAVVAAIWKGFSEGLAGAKRLREKKKAAKAQAAPAVLARFGQFVNPFAGGSPARDGNALVRYLWEAMLAMCADAGEPCAADQTPYEFVDSKPKPLAGFERPAHLIADMFTFTEFSGEQIPPEALPKLRQFWDDLQRQASKVGF